MENWGPGISTWTPGPCSSCFRHASGKPMVLGTFAQSGESQARVVFRQEMFQGLSIFCNIITVKIMFVITEKENVISKVIMEC